MMMMKEFLLSLIIMLSLIYSTEGVLYAGQNCKGGTGAVACAGGSECKCYKATAGTGGALVVKTDNSLPYGTCTTKSGKWKTDDPKGCTKNPNTAHQQYYGIYIYIFIYSYLYHKLFIYI